LLALKLTGNVSQIAEVARFSPQKSILRTEFSVTTKLSSRDETPPITNVLFCALIIFQR
jgi:indole-3-glycerol phosphate synthase